MVRIVSAVRGCEFFSGPFLEIGSKCSVKEPKSIHCPFSRYGRIGFLPAKWFAAFWIIPTVINGYLHVVLRRHEIIGIAEVYFLDYVDGELVTDLKLKKDIV